MELKRYLSTFHGLKTEAYFSRLVTTVLLCLVLFLVAVAPILSPFPKL